MYWNNFLIILLIVVFIPLLYKTFSNIRILIESIIESRKSFSLSEVLNRLTFKEYRLWCIDYLLSLGYSDVMFTTESEADLICKKDNKIYLVKCVRSIKKLVLNDIELLLGTMISEDIFNGLIITTGEISNEIEVYCHSMNSNYNIDIISKENFIHEYDEPKAVI